MIMKILGLTCRISFVRVAVMVYYYEDTNIKDCMMLE